MKYRILKDGELYYPQKRWYFIWIYFKDHKLQRLCFTDYERANDMIEIEKWLDSLEEDL